MESSTNENEYSEIVEQEAEEENEWRNVVIVENDNLSWQENSSEVTINYADATENPEQTITENESQIYISANAGDSLENSIDSPDKSEYYSILDTTYQAEDQDEDDENNESSANVQIVVRVSEEEQILPDSEHEHELMTGGQERIEDTETNQDEVQTDQEGEGTLENQVFLYHTEDSDEMYAVQIADDGNGNLQRYKYKVRQNEDGQLEAIPGTIQVQVDDMIEKHISECQNEAFLAQEEVQEEAESNPDESQIHEELLEDPQIHENLGSTNLELQANEIKTELLQPDFVAIKQEVQNEADDDFNDEIYNSEKSLNNKSFDEENFENGNESDEEDYGTPEYLLSENEGSVSPEPSVDQIENELLTNVEGAPVINSAILDGSTVSRGTLDKRTIDETFLNREGQNIVRKGSVEGQSTLQKYANATVLEEKKFVPKFFKSRMFNRELNKKIQHFDLTVEKENRTDGQNLKNSRSLLKNTVLSAIDDKETSYHHTLNNILENSSQKRTSQIRIISTKNYRENYSDNNENGSAKILEKSFRQPRKQKIKPVERSDSEIIVQPVFYFNQPESNRWQSVKRKRIFDENEIVKVSDSDDEITENLKDSRKKKKIMKKPKKIEQITISDSDSDLNEHNDSDHESVIEILTDNSKSDTVPKKINQNLKIQSLESTQVEVEPFDDIMKIQEAVDNIVQEREERKKQKEPSSVKVISKKNLKCPKCPKTFPREINLKNHMNVHSIARLRQTPLRAKAIPKNDKIVENSHENNSKEKKKDGKILNNFYCSRCKLKFLSDIQLKRHLTIHRDKKLTPGLSLTPKKFYGALRKSMVKDLGQHTPLDPKKCTKIVLSSSRRPFKCEQCGTAFTQKILLASHKIRHQKIPQNSRSSNIPGNSLKSLKKIPEVSRRALLSKKVVEFSRKSTIPKKSPLKTLTNVYPCKVCTLKFRTAESLQTHEDLHKKVRSKNVRSNSKIVGNTSSKNVARAGAPKTDKINVTSKKGVSLVSKSVQSKAPAASKNVNTRSKRPHAGVPTSNRMQEAFEMMKKLKS